jgi:hypothetical protein
MHGHPNSGASPFQEFLFSNTFGYNPCNRFLANLKVDLHLLFKYCE